MLFVLLLLIIVIIVIVLLIFFFNRNGKKNSSCYYRYDGKGNNAKHYNYGARGSLMVRKSYEVNDVKVNPRVISNALCKQNRVEKDAKLSDMFWVWGQFVDHEITLVAEGSEPDNMTTPENDQYPDKTIPFKRSAFKKVKGRREYQNQLSAYIDGANVYGFDNKRARALRTYKEGKLKVTEYADEVMPPLNENNLENANPTREDPKTLFLAGDIRANENPLLLGMHTLFIREHNRLCDILKDEYEKDEEIYQQARRIVIGQMQKITYDEFLPCIMDPIEYTDYDDEINPGIRVEFSTAGYRFGHSLLSSRIKFGKQSELLRDLFFNVNVCKEDGIDEFLLSATKTRMSKFDAHLIDDVRDFLFEPPTEHMMLDLASINIQRGRDHGLGGMNVVREAYGLTKYDSFDHMSGDPNVRKGLKEMYDSPDDVDLWIGCLCEKPSGGYPIGELTSAILREQFHALMHGDSHYYKYTQCLSDEWKDEIEKTKLSDIINRNCDGYVKQDVFRV